MSDLDASVTLSLSPSGSLALTEANGYVLVGVDTPLRKWVRRTAQGRYQHGRLLVSAVLDVPILTVQVRVVGSSWTDAASKWNALLAAVSAMSYTATVVIESVTTTYTCEPADTALAGGQGLDPFQLMASQQEYVLTIPVAAQ